MTQHEIAAKLLSVGRSSMPKILAVYPFSTTRQPRRCFLSSFSWAASWLFLSSGEGDVTAAPEATTAEIATMLHATLEWLRRVRDEHPEHDIVPNPPHFDCTICVAQRRLDWLLDKLHPPKTSRNPAPATNRPGSWPTGKAST